VTLAGLAGCGGPHDARPPNIVVVVIDTLRADHLEIDGYHRATAPHIARFAEQAAVFHRSYSHAPWTKPSIASLLTSLEPREHGITDWDHRLDEALVTLPRHLKALGYRTEAYVSHHALHPRWNDFHRGFDIFDTSAFEDRGESHYIASAREVSELAADALDRLERPFFLFVHYFDPHAAYLQHPEYAFGPSDVDRYDSEIAYTDHHLGAVLEKLASDGLRENTIVAITSDHGEEFLDHGGRYHTLTLFDEVLRVPLMIRAPGLGPHQIFYSVGLIDLAPTLLDLAALPIPEGFGGTPIPREGDRFQLDAHRSVFGETRREGKANLRCVVEGKWKLIHDVHFEQWALFNLKRDPHETVDVFDKRPDIVARLQPRLLEYEAQPLRRAPRQEMAEDLEELLEALGYAR
jgi:arylsulfatase A-like enzyme